MTALDAIRTFPGSPVWKRVVRASRRTRFFSTRFFCSWLGCTLFFVFVAHWQIQHSTALQLRAALAKELPEKLDQALRYGFSEVGVLDLVLDRINRDLQPLQATTPLPMVAQCGAQIAPLFAGREITAVGVSGAAFQLPWTLGERAQHSNFVVHCQPKWVNLIGSQILLALLICLLIRVLPKPLSAATRLRVRTFMAEGLELRSALQSARELARCSAGQQALFEHLYPAFRQRRQSLTQWIAQPQLTTLDAGQKHWLLKAVEISGDLDLCKRVALAPPDLEFDRDQCEVRIHGLTIPLAKTPFFYYLWYALQRLREEDAGWFLNPPVNRPDRNAAESLVELMEAHGGHNKSINDLRENGLRAKTLDQNRNKIRDELVSVLGESLAAPYLFESERDLKSGRYRHRLTLPAVNVKVKTD